MSTRMKELVSELVVALLLCMLGLAGLAWALPRCVHGEYYWLDWFVLLFSLRAVTYNPAKTACKCEDDAG